MKILKFEIIGLFGREEPINADLNSDLNIVTGPNGAGKTTVLKLLWYLISGNIHLAIREINFSRVTLITSDYSCVVHRVNEVTCRVEVEGNDDDDHLVFEDIYDDERDLLTSAEALADDYLEDIGSSIFFPTFRRIEGGFTLRTKRTPYAMGAIPNRTVGRTSDVEDGLVALSNRLTNQSHTFVASISTTDVVSLLLQRYAELSQQSQEAQRANSQAVIDKIKAYKEDQSRSAGSVIDDILAKIERTDADRVRIMQPFAAISSVAQKLFRHRGIRIGERISIGDAAEAINSDSLSAGEKQMLSFISYNAFYSDSIVFIDEPELSLHVDWQRQLFPTLLRQATSNQFIVATHSPFIYSKFSDKEILLGKNRGDSEN